LYFLDKLNEQALSQEEQLKRNVQIMRKALRSSQLEKDIHKQVCCQLSFHIKKLTCSIQLGY
jgi:hypothetical protein